MKDFLLLSSVNAVTYKEFFPLLKEGKARGGYNFNKTMMFETPEGELKKQIGITWFTTLPTPNKKKLILTKKYHKEDYPHYDNYNAIEVSRIKDIPYDYDCVMGVPITILQFDLTDYVIVDARDHTNVERLKNKSTQLIKDADGTIDGKAKYPRILIKKKIEIRECLNDHTPDTRAAVIEGETKYARILIRMKRGPKNRF